MNNIFNRGEVYTVIVTPFDNDGNIIFSDFDKMINYQIKNNISGIILLGTTSESPTIDEIEQKDIVNYIWNNFNNKITLQGILLTMYDKRNKICEMVSNDVKNHFNDKVFKTIIPRNVRISEAPSYGQPVLMYDISCPGSQAYASLAGEIINQEKDIK